MATLLKHVPGARVHKAKEKHSGTKSDYAVTIPGEVAKSETYLATGKTRVRKHEFDFPDTKRLASAKTPVELTTHSRGRVFWVYKGAVYVTTDRELKADDVLALVNEAANRRRLALEKAHALQAMTDHLDSRAKREPIPQDVKITVWQRDGGRCAECGSQTDLEFDHIIPLALGGANTMRNLQLLCAVCNRRKGATLG